MDKIKVNINDVTLKIIGCAMQVHSPLGKLFSKSYLQRELAIKMNVAGLSFHREIGMNIFYRKEQIGTRHVDFSVENCVIVELKAIKKRKMCFKNKY